MPPLVSAVITTYSRKDYVGHAIESVLAQSFQDWELIVVDDGSTDGTAEVLQSYAQRERRIRMIRQPNAGLSVARNAGMKEAKGKYLAFLDDDDRWLPEKLKIQTRFMEERPDFGLTYTRLRIMREVNGKLDDRTVFPRTLATAFIDLLEDCYILPSTVMIQISCLENMTWFDPECIFQEDLELWLRFSQLWKIGAIGEALTVMKKDGRPQLSQNEIESIKGAIRVIKRLKLEPDFKHFHGRRMSRIAKLNYKLGREYFIGKKYWLAAWHFAVALAADPLISLKFCESGERPLRTVLRVIKSYASVPACLVLGVLHGGR